MKKKQIGIIGLGVIGSAIKEGFEYIDYNILYHDINLNTKINNVINTDVCFICVPTPSDNLGNCDTTIVESVIVELLENNYQGLIAIKSTVIPGFTDKMSHKYKTKNISFVPEFLRERCAAEDFINNQDLCVIGAYSKNHFEILKEIHGILPKSFAFCQPKEAEFVKYFNNVYNATLITFANSFASICESLNVDYNNVKKIAVRRNHINDIYLNSSDKLKGFGGMCLPKDTKALNKLAEINCPEIKFFKNILDQNEKFKKTVFKGMRL